MLAGCSSGYGKDEMSVSEDNMSSLNSSTEDTQSTDLSELSKPSSSSNSNNEKREIIEGLGRFASYSPDGMRTDLSVEMFNKISVGDTRDSIRKVVGKPHGFMTANHTWQSAYYKLVDGRYIVMAFEFSKQKNEDVVKLMRLSSEKEVLHVFFS